MDIVIQYLIPIILGLTIGYLITHRTKFDKTKLHLLEVDAFKSSMRKGQLVDIRKKDKFEDSKIKGARNFQPRYIKHKSQTKVRKDLPVYLYCDNGKKSYSLGKRLTMKGFKEINVLKGGYTAYKSQ